MAEELLQFQNTVEDPDGRSHVATVLGAEREDGRWIGWIRFAGPEGEVIETGRETTQPNRQDLVYWSTGLTYFYLEGALARARRVRDGRRAAAAEGAASESSPRPDAGSGRAPQDGGVPRLEVLSASPGLAAAVMGARDPRPGTSRDVPDAGVVVYEGAFGGEGVATRHRFAVQFGSENAGATLANWLWSRLHGLGAEVRVRGQRVELTNDGLKRALTGR
jgi:hypothetical protein